MPFHDGAYYPYCSDTHGTHSSAGIPSLLNSPLSQAASAPGMTPSSGASTFLPFKFRPRRESVDWRRINAVDIEMVVSQLDVDALQEHISTVTFCSLDGERCQRCQSPVDPALVKLLQLAQLTVEWLLHCQEFLCLNLRAAEERVAAAGREREQLQAQQRKQEEKVKELTAELKQRKKMIRNQQSLLAPRITNSQKCLHCEKSFMNSSFLQNHMLRRHPDQYQIQLHSDTTNKSQMDGLKLEIISLKEQIVQQQQALQAKIAEEKEQQNMHKELQRELDRFKAEEMARMDRKIEDSRDGIRREMEFLYNQKIQALSEVNQNQTSRLVKPTSPPPEKDEDKQLQTLLGQQLKKQAKKWESKLQEIQSKYESEKNQLMNSVSRLQSSMLEQQEHNQELQQEVNRRLEEKEQVIRAQREQIKAITFNPPIKVVEVPVAVSALAPTPEPKPKRAFLEEPVSALKLDPIQELSEEERDSSSISEKRPVVSKPEPAPVKKPKLITSTLKKNPNIKKEMRPELELSLTKKLENLGVRSDQSGLKNKEFTSLLAKLNSQREAAVKGLPDYWRSRKELESLAEQKLGAQQRGSQPAPEAQSRLKQPLQVMQIRPRSSSLPFTSSQVTSGATVRHPKTPQPAPRTKTIVQPKTSTPNTKTTVRVVSSNSDEEVEDDESDTEEEPPRRNKLSKPRINQATPVQIKGGKTSPVQIKGGKTSPVQARHMAASQPFSKTPVGAGNRTPVTKMESEEEDDDWSDVSLLEEIDPKQVQGFKDQNGNINKKGSERDSISDLARQLEKKFAVRSVKKPAGGVSILPERKDEVQELLLTDMDESSEWLVSSLEDKQEVPKPAPLHGSGLLRKSLDSPSTSVWGTSSGKGHKSGLTEAGIGSTLKSSLHSFTDISDSDDDSNKHS